MSNTQTSYLLALQFGLLPEKMRTEAVRYLVSRVNERGHLTTGFLGTPHLNPVLTRHGYTGEAYELLLRKDYPSWLYPVTQGATTIWERWDGLKPDGTPQDPSMNSYNHYAYGAIGEWLYRTVAGLESEAPGYKRISVHPLPRGGLSYARALLETVYGTVESAWEISEDQFTVTVEIPANTNASVTLPGAAGEEVLESGEQLTAANGISGIGRSGSDLTVQLGSGRYTFTYSASEEYQTDEEAEAGSDADATPALSLSSKLAELIAVPQSRKVLNEQVPHLMNSPWLSQVMGFTLERASDPLPDEYRISDKKLKAIGRALQTVNAN